MGSCGFVALREVFICLLGCVLSFVFVQGPTQVAPANRRPLVTTLLSWRDYSAPGRKGTGRITPLDAFAALARAPTSWLTSAVAGGFAVSDASITRHIKT
jgi:hypothetical protein